MNKSLTGIQRLAGQIRVDTALAIAKAIYADALSISSSAAAALSPIILIEKDGFSAAVRQKIVEIKPVKVYLIGGKGVPAQKSTSR
ncbi:cell wall-binding repeat-containing protein [Desulfitobacterium sp. THU1]